MLVRSIPAWPCVAILVLGACHDGSSSGNPPGPAPLSNLGLAVAHFEGDEHVLVVGMSEPANGRDQNGDGDTRDEVAFVFDLDTGTGQLIGVALSQRASVPLTVRGLLAAMIENEDDSGGNDLNGDGDTLDDVLQVFDQLSGPAPLGPRLAVAPVTPVIEGGQVAFAVSEADEGGTDFTGDGDALDAVPRVFERTGGPARGPDVALVALAGLHGGWLAFTTDEAQLGNDLNGDGDATDASVLQFWDVEHGTLVNSGLEAAFVVPFIGPGADTVITSDWLVLVGEAAQGLDLDGDGDLEDLVAHTYSPITEETDNLAIACLARTPLADPREPRVCFFAREGPGLDRNADGDFEDVTRVVHDVRGGLTLDTALAAAPQLIGEAWVHGLLAFEVSETGQGADLDGDGQMLDQIVHVLDPATGEIQNLELSSDGLTGAPDHVLFLHFERENDWNHDGDRQDLVVFAWDEVSGDTFNTGVAGLVLGASSERLLLAVPELADGRDWNHDGDRGDLVYVHHDLMRGSNRGLDLLGAFPGVGRVLASNRSVVLVDEAAGALDLNEDGDRDDSVPFVVE